MAGKRHKPDFESVTIIMKTYKYDDKLRSESLSLTQTIAELEKELELVNKNLIKSCAHEIVVGIENWNSQNPRRICIFCGLEDECYGGWSLYEILSNDGNREVREIGWDKFFEYRNLQPLEFTIKT
jgi:hypothetical protein